jgi:hypothetical protein
MKRIRELLVALQTEALKYGVPNILQPGVLRELLMAEQLGHSLRPGKADADATNAFGLCFEYLSSCRRPKRRHAKNAGCNFQLDRMSPTNLYRVTRNEAFFFGVFEHQFALREIWRVETKDVLAEVTRQLGAGRAEFSHVNLLMSWVMKVGKIVFADDHALLE